MNFIFISPHFPANYWNFCVQLKLNGVNVLGIGDAPYDSLVLGLKNALTEYYRVDNMEDYDQMLRAVAYFTFKYGKIDWLESNNEYWLDQDARLREDFNIGNGFRPHEIARIKSKYRMKETYKKAGIPAPDCIYADDWEAAKKFAAVHGYPLILKPDSGVGAQNTYTIGREEDLEEFFEQKHSRMFVLEEFVEGEICSYDAIIDSKGEPIFESGNITPVSIMDIVNNQDSAYFYIVKSLAEDVREAGRQCAKAFDVRSRFVHFEFFRLKRDYENLGTAGTIVGLEVNMRPSGGFTPDMLNYANSVNVFKIWADMVAFDSSHVDQNKEHFFCAYVGRRSSKEYQHTHVELLSKYRANITMSDRMPDVLASAMGDQMYLAKFRDEQVMKEFFDYVLS